MAQSQKCHTVIMLLTIVNCLKLQQHTSASVNVRFRNENSD